MRMRLALNCKCQISDPSLRSGSHTDRHNFRQIIIVTSHASQHIPSSEMDSMTCCLQKMRRSQVWTGTSTINCNPKLGLDNLPFHKNKPKFQHVWGYPRLQRMGAGEGGKLSYPLVCQVKM